MSRGTRISRIGQYRGAASISGPAAVPKQFNPDIKYELQLAIMKENFDMKWETIGPSSENNLEGFEERGMLGEGSFGKVKLIKSTNDGKYFACKMLSKDQVVKTKQVTHTFNEKQVLYSVNFPFLTCLEFSSKDFDRLYFGLPFVNGGEVFAYHRRVRKFSEKHARFYAAQVFLALEYMHYMHLLYRDLKPENMLITNKGYIRITDFGFSKKVETRTLTLCGTPEYLAPEIIQSKPYGTSVDWWAFGVLIYEFVAGNSPFASHNHDVMTMYNKICDADFSIPSYFSYELKDLVENLLLIDVSKRIGNLASGNKDIKRHDWFKSVNWFSILNQEINAPYVPKISNMEDLTHFDKFREKQFTKSKSNRYAEIFADF